nr:MAG TPA: hypothetical protein [Caudoviricetes sp.]
MQFVPRKITSHQKPTVKQNSYSAKYHPPVNKYS